MSYSLREYIYMMYPVNETYMDQHWTKQPPAADGNFFFFFHFVILEKLASEANSGQNKFTCVLSKPHKGNVEPEYRTSLADFTSP